MYDKTLSSTLVHNTQSSSIFDVILYERESILHNI